MPTLIRTTLFSVLLLLFGASVALGQTFEIEADSTQLAPSNEATDIQCLVQLSSGTHVFFNTNAGGIYTWDGSSLGVHRSQENLNSDIPDESGSFDNCDGVANWDGSIYFILRSSTTNDNYIYRTEASNAADNSYTLFSGANALAADANSVYVGGISNFGAPSNGVFEISSNLSGSASEVVSNSDLNPGSMEMGADGMVYGFSTSFGSGDYSGTIFSVDVSASSPSLSLFTDPYAGDSPLTPDPQYGGGIDDLRFIDYAGSSYLVVVNGGGSIWEWGTIKVSDQTVEFLFDQTDLEENLSVNSYDAPVAPLTANSDGEVYAASGADSDEYYIAKVSDAPPLPVEMAGFDAVQNGGAVELRWQTASETNNAGFNIQHKTDRGWTTLGFVESKASAGTATEALSYRYTVGRDLDPGTHRFRLEQTDLDGSTSLSSVETVDVSMDAALRITAPAPNPAAGITTFSVGAKEAADATVALYNVLGQRVKTLSQRPLTAGQMRDVTFDASALPSGIYFVRLQADGQTRTERLTVVR